jgi:hypothetical protein
MNVRVHVGDSTEESACEFYRADVPRLQGRAQIRDRSKCRVRDRQCPESVQHCLHFNQPVHERSR